MDYSDKIRAVIALLDEVSCSQSLGEEASDIMNVPENDLYEVIAVSIAILEDHLD